MISSLMQHSKSDILQQCNNVHTVDHNKKMFLIILTVKNRISAKHKPLHFQHLGWHAMMKKGLPYVSSDRS